MLVTQYVLYHSHKVGRAGNQDSLNMERNDTPVKSQRRKPMKSAWFLVEVKR